jgi:hypothetical protein
MHAYADVHGRLPPAVVHGKDGSPLLSWRVLLLPWIEQQELYEAFRLDESWDSPHNLALLPRMPGTYAPPSGKRWRMREHHTVCQVFSGKGAAFERREGLSLKDDFPDGTSQTLLIVEAGEPVPWTKPQDLDYDPDGPLPGLKGLFNDGFRGCLADCSRLFVRTETSEASLRAAITRNGGDRPGSDW